jgi:hypothetical protein
MEIMLLNAQHGVLFIEETMLRQQWIHDQYEHFQVTVISKRIHLITCYRRELSGGCSGTYGGFVATGTKNDKAVSRH